MKRIFTLLLTLVMTFSLAIPAQAANSTKASTMRLMETEGTATVENAIGKKLSIQDKMRLYSGYEVSTEKASYAYISLDNSKAVKLDASSAVKVNQSGKKLELDVTAGELMFNVPVALKSDESLNIRTSTMVTGIRGTAGWVNALDRYTTRIGVLEGSVTIQSKDPFTGADRSVTIVGGQIATIIGHERANAIQQQLIDDGVIIEENIVAELTEPGQIVEEIQEADIPGFVAEEVSSNSDLQDRINEESPLDVEEIIQDADKRLDEEEKTAEKQDALIQKALKELDATNPGLPFAAPEVIIQTNTVTKTETEYVSSVLSNPTADEVNALLDTLDVVVVTDTDEDFLLHELDPESADTVYILDGDFILDSDWTLNGAVVLTGAVTVENNGVVTVNGSLEIGRGAIFFNNNGNIQVNSSNSFVIGGDMENYGNIVVGNAENPEAPVIGKLLIKEYATLYNYDGMIVIEGSALYPEPVSEPAEPAPSAESMLINEGTFYNGSQFINAGIFKNQNLFLNGEDTSGDQARQAAPPVQNYGIIENSGHLENYCAFYNAGTIVATGDAGYAFEQYRGTLYMDAGEISASGNASALFYAGEGLSSISGGMITHTGSGNGYALCINVASPSAMPSFSEYSNAYLKAGTPENLVGCASNIWSMDYNARSTFWFDGETLADVPTVRVILEYDYYGTPSIYVDYPYERNSANNICYAPLAWINYNAPN